MSNQDTVALITKRKRGDHPCIVWSRCLPFVDNSLALLVHRPRTVNTYNIHKHSHIGIGYWCGNHCSGGRKFTFLPLPPSNKLLCQKCEQNAVASGLPSADFLNEKHVHVGKLIPVQMCCQGAEP